MTHIEILRFFNKWRRGDAESGALDAAGITPQMIGQAIDACIADAERWRFVRSPIGTRSPYAIWNEGRMPVFCKIADACIDDAIRKEALDV